MFWKIPFADSGTKTAIPATDAGGAVNYTYGFGVDYQLEQGVDPDAKDIPRDKFNELQYQITRTLQLWQIHGFPDYITTADNGGTPFSYGINDFVRYDDGSGFKVYFSIAASNTALPTDATKWSPFQQVSAWRTGDLKMTSRATLESGFIWPDGGTIGNAASGATNRANADTSDLFTQIWTDYPNSIRPIQTSAGAPSTRGISAAADYAANKRLPVTDLRGNVPAGQDDMGGTSANRLTLSRPQGVDGAVLGAMGGEQAHVQDVSEIAAHVHTVGNGVVNDATESSGRTMITPYGLTVPPPIESAPAGNSVAFNVVQPTAIVNYMLKL